MAGEVPRPLPDAAARRRAATDFATNLVVLAGAGTGKTSLLVERALNALGAGTAAVDSIAAITFTEKAAGEMRERLAAGLDRLRTLALAGGDLDDRNEADRAYRHLVDDAGVGPDDLASRCLDAMERLDHGTVVTIHGFCSALLREFPVEAGVDPGFVVDPGEHEESLGREVWEAFVRDELGPGARRAAEWARLLSTLPLAQAGRIARRLAGFGVPLPLLERDGAAVVAGALRREADDLVDRIDGWLARGEDLAPLAERCLGGLRTVLDQLRTGGAEACRAALLRNEDLAVRVDNGRLGDARKRAGAEAGGQLKRLLADARDLCGGIARADDETLERLVRLVRPFVETFRERYLAGGLVGFDGLLALTRDLLRDRPDVRRRVKGRYRLLLVDEFQDTDPLQYEIVLFLAEEGEGEARDPFATRLAPGRLFVVGDTKQSIYRFRGADFAACRRAIDYIRSEGGEKLSLVGNFRSVPDVVQSVNELFAHRQGSWTESPYQPEYVPIEAVRPSRPDGPAVELWTLDLPDATRADERREAEGRVVADAIERWVDRDGGSRYERVTLLFRAFTNLSHYLRALRERDIPFVVDGGRDFLQRPEVAQLIATLRAIDRPADQPSLLAYLRSPAGAASDVELARYARAGGGWDWRMQPDADRFPNVAAAFRTLRELRDAAREMPVDRLVRLALERTAMLPLGALAFEGPQRVANLQKLAAAVGGLARDGRLSLDRIIDAVQEGRLEEIETDRPLADEEAQAVRVTNVHRMKGLENDIVVVPDLARLGGAGRAPSDPVRVGTTDDGRQVLALSSGRVRGSARVWYDIESGRHERAEEVRVLYVALTRARERLVLVAAKPRGRAPWLEALEPWGYDAGRPPADGDPLAGGRVRHRLRRIPSRPRPGTRPARTEESAAVAAYDEAVAALRDAARPPLCAAGVSEDEPAPDVAAAGSRLPGDVGRAVGEAVHRLLEDWDGRDRARIEDALGTICATTASRCDVDRVAVERGARDVLEGFLGSNLPDRLARVERLGAELPLLLRDDATGRIRRGRIDLLYRDRDGEVVVADFKTDRATDDETLRLRYAGQMGVYAEAVRLGLGLAERPRAELWLLRTGRIVTVDPPRADPEHGRVRE